MNRRKRAQPSWSILIALAVSCAAADGRADGETAAEASDAGDASPPLLADDEAPYRPTTSGPFVTFTAPLTPRGQLVLQPTLGAARLRGSFGPDGALSPLGPQVRASAVAATLFSELGLTDRTAVGVQLAGILNQRQEETAAASALGLADALLFARAVVLSEKGRGWLPEVTAIVQLKAPNGRSVSARADLLGTDVVGSGTTDVTVGVDLTKGLRPILAHVDLLFSQPFAVAMAPEAVHPGAYFNWSASVEWPILGGAFALMGELSGRVQADGHLGGERVPDSGSHEVVAGAGVEWIPSSAVQLLVGYQRTLTGRNALAADAIILTVVPTLRAF